MKRFGLLVAVVFCAASANAQGASAVKKVTPTDTFTTPDGRTMLVTADTVAFVRPSAPPGQLVRLRYVMTDSTIRQIEPPEQVALPASVQRAMLTLVRSFMDEQYPDRKRKP